MLAEWRVFLASFALVSVVTALALICGPTTSVLSACGGSLELHWRGWQLHAESNGDRAKEHLRAARPNLNPRVKAERGNQGRNAEKLNWTNALPSRLTLMKRFRRCAVELEGFPVMLSARASSLDARDTALKAQGAAGRTSAPESAGDSPQPFSNGQNEYLSPPLSASDSLDHGENQTLAPEPTIAVAEPGVSVASTGADEEDGEVVLSEPPRGVETPGDCVLPARREVEDRSRGVSYYETESTRRGRRPASHQGPSLEDRPGRRRKLTPESGGERQQPGRQRTPNPEIVCWKRREGVDCSGRTARRTVPRPRHNGRSMRHAFARRRTEARILASCPALPRCYSDDFRRRDRHNSDA